VRSSMDSRDPLDKNCCRFSLLSNIFVVIFEGELTLIQ
jgi:hypothetical protein